MICLRNECIQRYIKLKTVSSWRYALIAGFFYNCLVIYWLLLLMLLKTLNASLLFQS